MMLNNVTKIDSIGLYLCDLQANIFEMSVNTCDMSSSIFIRRFMNSDIVKTIDDKDILFTNLQPWDILDILEDEYGQSEYGSVKYTKNEMYWIGYIYRYCAYTYNMTSAQVYRMIKPKELHEVYLAYHTLDSSQAIERILEAKDLLLDESKELERQINIFKKYRKDLLTD